MIVYFRVKRAAKFITRSNWFSSFEVYEFYDMDRGFGAQFAVVYDEDQDDRILERVALYFYEWSKPSSQLQQPVLFAEREGSIWIGVKHLNRPHGIYEKPFASGVHDGDVWAVYPFDTCGDWRESKDLAQLRPEISAALSLSEQSGHHNGIGITQTDWRNEVWVTNRPK